MDGQPRPDSMLAYWLKHPKDLLELQRLGKLNKELRDSCDVEAQEALLQEVRDFLIGMADRMGIDK